MPRHCGVFSYGFEQNQLSRHSCPPLSVIDISVAELAHTAMQLTVDILTKGITSPQHIEIAPRMQMRDSF